MDNVQTSNLLILVKPTYLPCFQSKLNECSINPDKIHSLLNLEFDKFIESLKKYKIKVLVFDSPKNAEAATFPNNWITSHVNPQNKHKTIIIYPMENPNRRLERMSPLMNYIKEDSTVVKLIDLSFYERDQMFLEGTGSMVLDRVHKVAYCDSSSHTNLLLAKIWCLMMNYELCSFKTSDEYHSDVYHTNIMMSIGEQFVIICLPSIVSENDRRKVLLSLKKTGRIIINITIIQMAKFCGNCLQVRNQLNELVLCLSLTAYQAFEPYQLQILENFCNGGLMVINNHLMELFGGGSVRCNLLEYGF